ncbi:MAG TPA: hypothetical protein VK095_09540 [Beutenbergiaceae bacterium]|nr:hypothetical protein [Beutenbergiaceae bacterium]
MTSPVFILLLSAVAAITVAIVLLRARAPRDGYRNWFREAFRAVRTERRARRARQHTRGATRHARSATAGRETAEAILAGGDVRLDEELHVADLLGMSDEGPAYQAGVDLRRVVRRVRLPGQGHDDARRLVRR